MNSRVISDDLVITVTWWRWSVFYFVDQVIWTSPSRDFNDSITWLWRFHHVIFWRFHHVILTIPSRDCDNSITWFFGDSITWLWRFHHVSVTIPSRDFNDSITWFWRFHHVIVKCISRPSQRRLYIIYSMPPRDCSWCIFNLCTRPLPHRASFCHESVINANI